MDLSDFIMDLSLLILEFLNFTLDLSNCFILFDYWHDLKFETLTFAFEGCAEHLLLRSRDLILKTLNQINLMIFTKASTIIKENFIQIIPEVGSNSLDTNLKGLNYITKIE